MLRLPKPKFVDASKTQSTAHLALGLMLCWQHLNTILYNVPEPLASNQIDLIIIKVFTAPM